MLKQEDILGDLQFSAGFWSGHREPNSGATPSDPALVSWRVENAVSRIHKFFKKNKTVPPLEAENKAFQISSDSHWRRLRKRWDRTQVRHGKILSVSDPATQHYQKMFKKCERLRHKEPTQAVDQWLAYESEYWDYIFRCLGQFEANRKDKAPHIKVDQVHQIPHDKHVGIYNKSYNAGQLREWFYNSFPELAREWDLNWASYWAYFQNVQHVEEIPGPQIGHPPSEP